jgi:hypothetical protein
VPLTLVSGRSGAQGRGAAVGAAVERIVAAASVPRILRWMRRRRTSFDGGESEPHHLEGV